ncbi:hypothetical protein NL676_009056 [Syzygium grande]|nr:hypothetical protein NL676_009056 [Syzygium grande]
MNKARQTSLPIQETKTKLLLLRHLSLDPSSFPFFSIAAAANDLRDFDSRAIAGSAALRVFLRFACFASLLFSAPSLRCSFLAKVCSEEVSGRVLSCFDDDDLPRAVGGFSRGWVSAGDGDEGRRACVRMGIQTARSNVGWLQKSAAHYNQLPTAPTSRKVCTYWLKGKCNRNPCRFLHDASLPRNVYHRAAKQSSYMREDCPGKGPESSPVNSASSTSRERGDLSKDKNPRKPQEKVCNYWMSDNCVKGNACPFLHSWFHGVDFALLAKLEGHKKVVSGIALPSGSNKLYSGSKDGTARIWDCHTGQCVQVINLGGEVGCFTCEGPWVFVGMPKAVKAWNIQNGASYDISGPVGQDGAILVWKGGNEADPFQMAAPLRGHTWGVVSLTVGRDRLYSGSIDQTIRVWDLHTLECVQELVGHTDVVTSLLCWDQYLLSCSLDQTVRVWGATEDCSLEVVYTHREDHGILALSGMLDAGGKPVLLCACIDNTVRLYELPSFTERGKIFSRREVRTLQTAPGGLFFTGDATGMLTGILALAGMLDAGGKPVLLCACIDNTVRLYELPSFTERGKIFSRREVRTLQTAPGGLFFTGDAAGMLTVWNWLDSPKNQEEQLPHSMESC